MAKTWTLSTIEVRYAETDNMGLVHHSCYPIYFEVGRSEFFQEHLIPYHQLESQGLLAPVLEYQVRISGPLRYGETLTVKTSITKHKGLRVHLEYEGRVSERLVVTGTSLHALVGRDLKPIHPRKAPASHQALLKEISKLL